MKSPRVVISPQHPLQQQVFDAIARHRFVIAVCGRRFGKTTIGVEQALRDMRRPRYRGWIIAPTRQMVKDLFWEPLKERADRLKWRISKNETDLTIERLSTRARYTLHSGERPERLRGRGLNRAIVDEASDMDATMWPEVIRPALADRRGDALFTGTPSGRNHFYTMFQDAADKPDWARFQFKTIHNPYIDPAEIAAIRASVDDRTFRQEMEADFVEYLGAAYSYHDPTIHCIERPFDPNRPIYAMLDFNIDPCVWELGQSHVDIEYIFDEICQRQTDIWRMCADLKSRLIALAGGDEMRARVHPVIFYGDYTSTKRRDMSAVDSSWGIIRIYFDGWNTEYRLKNNPRVVDRLNSMNALMRGASGNVRFGYSKKAVMLGLDFTMCSVDDVMKKGAVGDRTHASDGVGYFADYEHPIVKIISRQYND